MQTFFLFIYFSAVLCVGAQVNNRHACLRSVCGPHEPQVAGQAVFIFWSVSQSVFFSEQSNLLSSTQLAVAPIAAEQLPTARHKANNPQTVSIVDECPQLSRLDVTCWSTNGSVFIGNFYQNFLSGSVHYLKCVTPTSYLIDLISKPQLTKPLPTSCTLSASLCLLKPVSIYKCLHLLLPNFEYVT